jgi:hypothetical protein
VIVLTGKAFGCDALARKESKTFGIIKRPWLN